MALDHASNGHDCLTGAILLESSGLDERVDGLFLRGVDEAARIHDDDLGGGEVADGLGAAADQAREVALAVDSVLVAAQSDEADFHSEKLVGRPRPLNDSRGGFYR